MIIIILLPIMKTVISEGNLSGYYLNKVDVVDIDKLNRKIKSIKTALKIAEKHNEDLHLKIRNQKENHQMEIIQLENQYKKYKELYEMLLEKYQLKNVELKEYKKKVKRMEVEQRGDSEEEELYKEFKETIVKQEKELVRVKEENKLLYDQLFEKNNKLKDLQAFISKNYHQQKLQFKDRSFLANLKSAIESKNDQFDKLNHQKGKLLTYKQQLEKQNNEMALKMAKVVAELEFQKRAGKECKQKLQRCEREMMRLGEENKGMVVKYNQLLNFSYDTQKEMQRQLQSISKDIFRRDHK